MLDSTQGMLFTPRTVYLNSAFVDAAVPYPYVDALNVPQIGTSVSYITGDPADTMTLVFQESPATLLARINAQPSVGNDPLSVYSLQFLNDAGGNSTIVVVTDKIWWVEDNGVVSQCTMVVYNKTNDLRRVYTNTAEDAASVQATINN